MKWIFSLLGKITGANAIWKLTDGVKGYLTGVLSILTGAVGLINEWVNVSGAHDFPALWAFIQGFSKDPNWLAILAGFAMIAASHKAQKVIEATKKPE